ncbi:MAG: amino acid ABC transporter permease [Alcaligenaceae bacterium]|nr:amino acid ABC transporter permease [Alcaligenaceae bacterium]
MDDFWLAPHYISWLLKGFGVTLVLSLCVAIAATFLGFFVCLARVSSSRLFSGSAKAFLSVFRNTPLLIQLFFWYFGVSSLLPSDAVSWLNTPHMWTFFMGDIHWPAFEYLAGFTGLTLYTAAFIAEELRSGVQSVSIGQRSAGMALGLKASQIWRYIIFPQAIRNAFPSLLGQYMNLIKNTSLTMAIGLAELSYASRQVETETFKTFQAFGIATILYVLAIVVLEVIGQRVLQSRAFAQGKR